MISSLLFTDYGDLTFKTCFPESYFIFDEICLPHWVASCVAIIYAFMTHSKETTNFRNTKSKVFCLTKLFILRHFIICIKLLVIPLKTMLLKVSHLAL